MDIPVLLAGLLVFLSKIVSNATFRGRHLAECIFRLTLSECDFYLFASGRWVYFLYSWGDCSGKNL